MARSRRSVVAASVVALLVTGAACGSDSDSDSSSDPVRAADTASTDVSEPADGDGEGVGDSTADATALRTVAPAAAASTIESPPDDLVILDVRTAEEFAEGHVEGATMLDFYRDDFAEELAQLDRDVPYVVYCRSGNRSGQTLELMRELGFTSVEEVDGGIVSWVDAGLPVVVTDT